MSKPIDQELLPCPFCGSKNPYLNQEDYTDPVVVCRSCHIRVQAELWNRRAAVQPAGVAVPDTVLVDREWLCELQKYVSSFEKQDELRAMLAAAPHPVRGEPTTDELHRLDKQCRDDVARAMGMSPVGDGYPWSGLLAGIKVMASRPAAQDVAGLVEALESSNLLLRTKRHACTSSQVCHLLDSHIKRNEAAIAAHRAQQGEQP